MWNNSYGTPTEHWQKISKGKKLPTYLGRAKEKRKNRDKEQGRDPHQWEGAEKEERFPHTRSPFTGRDCGWRRGEASEPRRRAQPQGCGGQSGEIPAQRIGATSTHQPERLVCSPAGAGGGWELRLWRRWIPGRGLGLAA